MCTSIDYLRATQMKAVLFLESCRQLRYVILFTLLSGEGEEKDKGGNPESLKECVCVLVITNCILKSIIGHFVFTIGRRADLFFPPLA